MQTHTLAQISFGPWPEEEEDSWKEEVEYEFHGMMKSLIRQGQIMGDYTNGVIEGELRAFVSLPARDALEPRHFSKYAAANHSKMEKRFGQPMKVRLLSPGNVVTLNDTWQNAPWLVLLSSMNEEKGVIATSNLERLPGYTLPLDADTHEQVYFWARNAQRHQGLWLNGTSLERACLKALADPLSELNRQAARLAYEVEQAVGKPVYSALFRHYALPGDAETQRPCPLCGADWRVEGELFPFRCEPCRLIGDIGPAEDKEHSAWIGTWDALLRRSKPDYWRPASSRSLLGQLQRGRGDGYQRLLNEAPPRAWALIEDCLRHDPRLDRQVESRSWYYGMLIQKTVMPLNRVWQVLKEVPDDDTLVLEVIGWLAAKGSAEAAAVLEEQIRSGPSWEKAAHELAESPEEIAGPRICRALRQRFPQPEDLAAAIQEFGHSPSSLFFSLRDHPSQEVQTALCLQENRLATFKASDGKAALECAEMSLPELVEKADDADANIRALTQAAEKQVKPPDVPWLWQALDLAQSNRCRVILAALRQITDETMLPELLALVDQIRDKPEHRRFQPQLTRLFLRLPSPETLPLARLWIHDDSPLHKRIARRLLATHADESDLPLLRKLLAKGLQNHEENLYLICDCLEAYARFANHGMIEEVARAYTKLRYDYGRMLAVKALAALCPETFREEYAKDCQYDSQEETRAFASAFPLTGTA